VTLELSSPSASGVYTMGKVVVVAQWKKTCLTIQRLRVQVQPLAQGKRIWPIKSGDWLVRSPCLQYQKPSIALHAVHCKTAKPECPRLVDQAYCYVC
jgi:hypothetical protein